MFSNPQFSCTLPRNGNSFELIGADLQLESLQYTTVHGACVMCRNTLLQWSRRHKWFWYNSGAPCHKHIKKALTATRRHKKLRDCWSCGPRPTSQSSILAGGDWENIYSTLRRKLPAQIHPIMITCMCLVYWKYANHLDQRQSINTDHDVISRTLIEFSYFDQH